MFYVYDGVSELVLILVMLFIFTGCFQSCRVLNREQCLEELENEQRSLLSNESPCESQTQETQPHAQPSSSNINNHVNNESRNELVLPNQPTESPIQFNLFEDPPPSYKECMKY